MNGADWVIIAVVLVSVVQAARWAFFTKFSELPVWYWAIC